MSGVNFNGKKLSLDSVQLHTLIQTHKDWLPFSNAFEQQICTVRVCQEADHEEEDQEEKGKEERKGRKRAIKTL